MRLLPILLVVACLGLAAPLRAAGIGALRATPDAEDDPLAPGDATLVPVPVPVPAALAPGLAARLRPRTGPEAAISFQSVRLQAFAGRTRLELSGLLELARGDGVVAVDPELVMGNVEDALGRRPGAWRLRAGARFAPPLEFREDVEHVEVHAQQGTLPGDLRAPVRVTGHAAVLRAVEVASAELPAAPTDGELELAPGLRVRLRNVGPSLLELGLWDVEGRWWRRGASASDDYATPFIRSVVLVDDAGHEHRRSPWPAGRESRHGVESGFHASYTLPRGVKPATLRFEVVERTRVEQIPFQVDLATPR